MARQEIQTEKKAEVWEALKKKRCQSIPGKLQPHGNTQISKN